jgi:predicted secreted hydrolase
MGSKSMTESDSNDVNIVPPRDWNELVGRFMNLEDSIRGEDSGLEIRVEVLESIAEEQGFSVRWEEENTVGEISTEETSFEDFEEVDMNEVI